MRVLERLEALKLLRCFLTHYEEEEDDQEEGQEEEGGDRALCLSASAAGPSSSAATLLMALVAVAGHAGGEGGGGGPVEDVSFRKLCLETLRCVGGVVVFGLLKNEPSTPWVGSCVARPTIPHSPQHPPNKQKHREIAVAHPGFVAACDGFKPLVASVLDGALHAELAEPVLLTLLHLADHPRTRRRFRPFLELHAVLAPFTTLDAAAAGPERAALLEVCVVAFDGCTLVFGVCRMSCLPSSHHRPMCIHPTHPLTDPPKRATGGPPRAPRPLAELGGGHTPRGPRAQGAARALARGVGRRVRGPGGALGRV